VKIQKANARHLIEWQSGQFDRAGVLETFRRFDNTAEEIKSFIDELLINWQIEERNGRFYWAGGN